MTDKAETKVPTTLYRVTPEGKSDAHGWDVIMCAACAEAKRQQGYVIEPLYEMLGECGFWNTELHKHKSAAADVHRQVDSGDAGMETPKTLYAEFQEWWKGYVCYEVDAKRIAEDAYIQGRADQSKLFAESSSEYQRGIAAAIEIVNYYIPRHIAQLIDDAAAPSFEVWQPMESAPRDSSWILAAMRTGRQAVVRWGGGTWEDDSRLCRDPIRWMPLPPITTTEVAGEDESK